jgi:hypothetical protein
MTGPERIQFLEGDAARGAMLRRSANILRLLLMRDDWSPDTTNKMLETIANLDVLADEIGGPVTASDEPIGPYAWPKPDQQ